MRRNQKKNPVMEQPKKIVEGDLSIELDSRVVTIAGDEINLTAKEFNILTLLLLHPNKVYSRDDLLKAVWGSDSLGDGRTVDVHVRRLREKVEENPGEPKYIQTKWGVGYYFKK